MLARKALREAAEGQEGEWDRQRRKAAIDATVATAQYRIRRELNKPTIWDDLDDLVELLKRTYPESAATLGEKIPNT
jgi:hypothetical protein